MRSSPRLQRRLFVAALSVFGLGVVVATVSLYGNTATFVEAPLSDDPADLVTGGTTVPVAAEAREVARLWIMGAVTRRDLVSTYDLTHEDIRGSLTRAEWETGSIPVIPYPVDEIKAAQWRTDYSYVSEAMLQVRLNPGLDAPPGQRALTFFVGLVRIGEGDDARWLVNYWAPRYRPGVPLAQ